MDFLSLKSDFLNTNSKLAELITIAHIKLESLEFDINQIENDVKYKNDENVLSAEQIKFNEEVKIYADNYKKQMIKFQLFGRGAALKYFLFVNNYLHTLRVPIGEELEERYKTPIYEIIFPDSKRIDVTQKYHKSIKKKAARKCNVPTKKQCTCYN